MANRDYAGTKSLLLFNRLITVAVWFGKLLLADVSGILLMRMLGVV